MKDLKTTFRSTSSVDIEVMNEVAAASETQENFSRNEYVLIDLKGMFNRKEAMKMGFFYWGL